MAQEPLSAAVLTSLMREMKELTDAPPDGIKVIFNEDNLADISAELEGPAGTPYEGGLFKMKLCLPADFPAAPPKGYFVTKIFHPNIMMSTGEICVNTLKKDWAPTHGIRHILMVVRCLLIAPFPESALNEEAAKMLLEEYEEYFRRAKMLTGIHAARRGAAAAAAGAGGAAGEAGPSGAGGAGASAPMSNATNTLGCASAPMSNATNTLGSASSGSEGGAGGACADGGAAKEGPPLKKLDRKKSLKRL